MAQRKKFPTFIILLLFGYFTCSKCRWILSYVIYEDMERLNATCENLDSCANPRTNEPWKYNCNCDDSCSFLGTCCVDSIYRQKYNQKYLGNVRCRMLNHKNRFRYPWISSCNPHLQYDQTVEELCHTRGFVLGDPFLEIPVTDPVTGITYQNYYCYACNENSGEERLIPWNMALRSNSENINGFLSFSKLRNYEKNPWKWVMDNDNGSYISLWPAIPEELENLLPFCYGFRIISECALSWREENTRNMCLAYMALTRIRNGSPGIFDVYKYYRNPHCAICNYESIDDMVCGAEMEFPDIAPGGFGGGFGGGIGGVFGMFIPFHDFFVRLIKFSEEKKKSNCPEGMAFDHYAKKCRIIYKAVSGLLGWFMLTAR